MTSFFYLFLATIAINEAKKTPVEKTRCMKKFSLNQDTRGKNIIPPFLHEDAEPIPEEVQEARVSKSPVFRPVRGIKKRNSLVGNTKHSKDCSYYLIPPHDYQDIMVGRDFEGVELLGYQAMAAVNSLFF